MKTNVKTTTLLLGVAAFSILNACQKEDPASNAALPPSNVDLNLKSANARTFYGPDVSIGEGTAHAWVTENEEGEPTAVGVKFTENALLALPSTPSQYVLYFPEHRGKGFYKHILIDWNPQGHEPAPIYGLPHFDFHFYIIPNEQRLAIAPMAPPALDPSPAASFIPPMYSETPGRVPQMGAHWVDLLSPEFHGVKFTNTYIWGSYSGKFIFWEPMLTLAYLQSQPNDLIPLRQPAKYQKDGWYAQKYQVSYSLFPNLNTGEYTVALKNLKHYTAIER